MNTRLWRYLRRLVQYLTLILFLYLFVSMMKQDGQPSLSALFTRLDPLLALGSMVAARQVIVSFAPALAIVLLTLAVGRVWCGWICPLGTILDFFGPRGQRGIPQKFRQVKYYILFTILFLALFGSLAFMFFDPITVLIRGLAGVIYPGLEKIAEVPAIKTALENIGILEAGVTRPLSPRELAALPSLGEQLVALPWAATSLLLIILVLNIVERRFWCRYLCPLGGFIGLLSRFAWVKREVKVKEGVTPCRLDCPAGTNVVGYTALISKGKFREAVDLIRQQNPLTSVCGHVCPHPCETNCNRSAVDAAVGTNNLERFVTDYVRSRGKDGVKPSPITSDKKVAVIGAGPAGLSAAYHLRKNGYPVKVFEKLPEPGGMLVAGIPKYRLPREVLQYDIDFIKKHGVEIQTKVEVDREKLAELRQEYDALFISVGAHQSRELGIPGEDLAGVIHGVSFLRDLNLDKEVKVGSRVAVIGGGDVAIDAARGALRLGSEVTIYYRRSREEMPARWEEIEEAEEEGVKVQYLAAPTRIIGEDGRVVGLECVRSELGAPDESGRRRPIPIAGSEFVEPVDMVIPAIGQNSDLALLEGSGIEVERGWVKANEAGVTSVPGVFAGGDVVTGPAMVTDAIGAGVEAATAIDRYLRGKPVTVEERPAARIKFEDWPREKLPEKVERKVAATIDLERRKKSFDEVRLGLTRQEAIEEARRCINWNCAECTLCAQICPMGTIESKDFTSHPSECTVCMDCVADCPPGVTSFKGGWISSPVHEYDPSRRQLLASGATAVVGYGLLRTGIGKSENAFLLRPPGANNEVEFLAKCARCGQCLKVCPQQTLRPALFEAGWDGIWTPVLVPLQGGCDYDCNTCGQVCPSGAIPPLALAEKRSSAIGVAVVNEETCIGCMICAEVCPVEGGIKEIEVERDGKQEPLPEVAADLCIGCGVCEFECPVKDKETPIRVNVRGVLAA